MINNIVFANESSKTSDLSKVDGIAYNGGTIKQDWAHAPVVVDLNGLEIAPQIPLLLSHTNSPEYRLGVVVVSNDGSCLSVTGGIDTSDKLGKEIVEKGKKYDWQLSIGADVNDSIYLPENEKRTINGKSLTGPLIIISHAKLREISVVAVGADAETYLHIAASFNTHKTKQGVIMDEEIQKEPAPVGIQAVADLKKNDIDDARKSEIERIRAVAAITAEYPEIGQQAISAGWTSEFTESVINNVTAAARKIPVATPNVIVRDNAINAKTLEAALCLQANIPHETIEAQCGKQALDIADSNLRGIGLKGVMAEAARLEGKKVGIAFDNEAIRAAFSTVSLPGILNNVANKAALKSFTAQTAIAEKLCTTGDLADFKESERYRLNDVGDLQLLTHGGELKHGSVSEDKATNQLDTYGKIFTLTRKMIINDDLGEFLKIPAAMGARAKRKIDQVFFSRLLENPVQNDGNALFHAKHLNYKTGADTALGVDSLEKAITLFLDQVDSDGNPIVIEPKYLLVPTVLYPLAQKLTSSALLIGGSSTQPAENVIANYGITAVASPYLANSKYSGHSDTGFYLFADPATTDTFEIGYLKGKNTPTVEKGETDFTTLGMQFRVFFDFGIREQDHRGIVFFKGKA